MGNLFKINKSTKQGFTLIELLIVISILALLLVVVLVALKPAERLADSRDVRRAIDINQLLTGVHECVIDEDVPISTCVGSYTAGETYEIVSGAITSGCDDVCTAVTSDSHCLRLDTTLDNYFTSIPADPGGVATGHTEYTLTVYSNGMTVLDACSAENSTIKVSR